MPKRAWMHIGGWCLAAGLAGCSSSKPISDVADLVLTLGPATKMCFVYIPALKQYVGKYEVSNKEYRCFKPEHNSGEYQKMTLNLDDQPVVNVSWNDTLKFCEWLTKTHGYSGAKRYNFRLPKEQEWETFAACGQPVEYPWGIGPIPCAWNYFGVENPEPGQKLDHDDGYRVSCPVQKSGANAWGLFGVGGNVWEWCEDADGASQSRVYKGASWSDCQTFFLKLTRRSSNLPDYRYVNLGFRIVVNISDVSVEEQKKLEDAQRQKTAEAKATKAKEEAEALRQAAENKEQAEQAKQEKMTVDQTLIQGLIADKKFDLAAAQIARYEKDYGKDAFAEKWSASLENTKVLNLSASVTMEFVRIPPLNIWMGKYEVSNKQFREFQTDHDSGMFKEWSLNDAGQPVVNVSWDDANAFCLWLNKRLASNLEPGRELRLPTESEWETAAACGQEREYPWGNQWPPKYGNYGLIEGYDDGAPVACPVEDSGQNEWGLYGMGGNAWEWCFDLYDPAKQYRVIRGGAWNLTTADALKISNRTGDSESRKNNYIGFRVVIGSKSAPSIQ